MPTPDSLVATAGESVTLIRVTAPVYVDDVLDEAASTITEAAVNAIVSLPSEKDLRLFQGRSHMPTLRLTVASSTDVRADRAGRNDRIRRSGVLYQVEEVRADRHPFVGTAKKTVYLVPLPGR